MFANKASEHFYICGQVGWCVEELVISGFVCHYTIIITRPGQRESTAREGTHERLIQLYTVTTEKLSVY